MKNLGIYIHIPFCTKKCPYCDFYTLPYNNDLELEYINACIKEIKDYANDDYLIDTIYFGGGTPNLAYLSIPIIINAIYNNFKVDENVEITVECNPCSTTKKTVEILKSCKINRLSFGVQSFVENELQILGRLHSNNNVKNIIHQAQNIGFDNISIDIMIATPYQKIENINKSIKFISELDIQHISMYILKIEKNTEFGKKNMGITIPDDETTSEFYIHTLNSLENLGFIQYEISNLSKQNFKSKHNLKYWTCQEYIGIGPSSHSYLNGKRFYHKNNIKSYINNYKNTLTYNELCINLLEEYIMLNLRLTSGIDLNYISENFDVDLENFLKKSRYFYKHGLLIINNNKIYCTKNGFLLSNYIISELLMKI